MRIWSAAIVVMGMGSGCKYGPYDFTCTGDISCGASGICEPNGFCSFPDNTCSSGRRFGDLDGPSAGQCVGGPDAPPDARGCFGTAPFTFCFTAPPTGTIDVSTPTTFDTVTGTVTGTQLTCSTPRSGDPNNSYCVLAANTITISAPLRATGISKPLVLVAVDSISVPMSIDVSSHRMGSINSFGAGAAPPGCDAGTSPGGGTGANGSGGGAGGSFIGAGGNGGNGGGAAGGTGGVRGNAPGLGTVLRGGCSGQNGAGSGGAGSGGGGGGAVFLIAGNNITVSGMINAGGEGGTGAFGVNAGAGGGGAGGMIGFDAPSIMVTGTLIANGGGGGEGGSSGGSSGNPGNDAQLTTAAPGGAFGSTSGGDGGNGSAGAAFGAGATGQDGSATGGGGGGGGGGGAGIIKAPATATIGPNVSPQPP